MLLIALAAVIAAASGLGAGAAGIGQVEANTALRERAYAEAVERLGEPYRWGGRERKSGTGLDCSGLIIAAYAAAMEGTPWSLPFDDTTAGLLFEEEIRRVARPQRGDLVFLDFGGSGGIDHVALIEGDAGVVLRVIDAVSFAGAEEVQRRDIEREDPRIRGFGRLVVRRSSLWKIDAEVGNE
jgi:hypothetical protein